MLELNEPLELETSSEIETDGYGSSTDAYEIINRIKHLNTNYSEQKSYPWIRSKRYTTTILKWNKTNLTWM